MVTLELHRVSLAAPSAGSRLPFDRSRPGTLRARAWSERINGPSHRKDEKMEDRIVNGKRVS